MDMAIYEEVLAWADRLPPWRQDTLQRRCIQGAWNEADLGEILDLAKQHHGINSAMDPAPQPIRFSTDHFPAEANRDNTVVLTSLHTLNWTIADKIEESLSISIIMQQGTYSVQNIIGRLPEHFIRRKSVPCA
jgi:hypothetical protein